MVPFTPLIDSLPELIPFVGPEAIARKTGIAIIARLGANENGFGPSPKAIAAMQEAARLSWAYGDPEVYDLRKAIADFYQIGCEHVGVGEGIDGLLGLILRLIVTPETTVVTSQGAYPTFNFHVAACGGRLITTPYIHDRESPGHLLDLARKEKAQLIYFANPDNPMGTVWPAHIVQEMIDHLPDNCLLLLDEAYGEFAPGSQPHFCLDNPKVLRFRTFSKAYGLAGIRVGYMLGHARYVSACDKIRNHFGISRVSQAGAIAALDDQAYLSQTYHHVAQARHFIATLAEKNGLHPIPSATNFVAIDCGRDHAYARQIVDGLAAHGIFIRMPGVSPLNRCIRVSVGPQAELDVLAEKLPQVLAALKE